MIWLERNATKAFWMLFFLQLLCWTIIPTLFQSNAPLDVIEGLAWGREWPLGTYKHPPLQAWLLESATYLFGQSGFGYFGLSALCSSLTLWAVYFTARLFVGKPQAFIATLLTQNIFYLNLLSTEFNPNVLQMVLGALATYAFTAALIKNKMRYWLMCGIFITLGLYAKYSMAIYGISFLLFLIAQKEARPLLFRPHIYMVLALCLALFMPHLQWLLSNSFLPFEYAASRSQTATSFGQQLFFPLKFLSAQVLDMLLALLIGACIFLPLKKNPSQNASRESLLAWIAFAPLVIMVIGSLASGQKLIDMWGMPYLSFIPVWAVYTFQTHIKREKLFLAAGATGFALCLFAFCANLLFAPALGFKPLRGHFPGAEISKTFTDFWQKQTGAPLTYVIGDAWLAGNVAFYSPDVRHRPHVWIDGSGKTSPWINPRDVRVKGAVVLWQENNSDSSNPPAWTRKFQSLKIQKPLIFQRKTTSPSLPVFIGWGVIQPE
ncbi:MAG: glycosyltransferase family 39 protein [Methylococcaceae bacterium]|nr:MAG: glycosyltransferase family 39 protein [Methylococcaceae bacterium]